MTRFQRRVGEWNDGVLKVTLFATWPNSHIVDIQSIFCKGFVGEGAVKEPDHDFIRVQVLEDINCMLHLIHQLG